MKKTIAFIFIFICTSISYAQLINGFGITGGISYCRQTFEIKDPLTKDNKKYLLGFNGSFFIEFSNNDYVRWVTELQYNEKGSKEKTDPATYTNKLQYGCFNNYLKLRKELIPFIPYILIGPRVDYMIAQNTASPAIIEKFAPLHISAALGAGIEFISYSNFKFFVEGFYNPDLGKAYEYNPLAIYNKNIELRIGLKYVTGGRRKSCNGAR